MNKLFDNMFICFNQFRYLGGREGEQRVFSFVPGQKTLPRTAGIRQTGQPAQCQLNPSGSRTRHIPGTLCDPIIDYALSFNRLLLAFISFSESFDQTSISTLLFFSIRNYVKIILFLLDQVKYNLKYSLGEYV